MIWRLTAFGIVAGAISATKCSACARMANAAYRHRRFAASARGSGQLSADIAIYRQATFDDIIALRDGQRHSHEQQGRVYNIFARAGGVLTAAKRVWRVKTACRDRRRGSDAGTRRCYNAVISSSPVKDMRSRMYNASLRTAYLNKPSDAVAPAAARARCADAQYGYINQRGILNVEAVGVSSLARWNSIASNGGYILARHRWVQRRLFATITLLSAQRGAVAATAQHSFASYGGASDNSVSRLARAPPRASTTGCASRRRLACEGGQRAAAPAHAFLCLISSRHHTASSLTDIRQAARAAILSSRTALPLRSPAHAPARLRRHSCLHSNI